MSKAFTREDEGAPSEAPARPLGPELPPGVKNYVTPEGAARLREEIDRLTRDRATSAGDPAALREIDRRAAFLARRLELAEIIDPPAQPPGRVLFGASVTVQDEGGGERRYRLVGVDEANPQRGEVSWRSPIAAALLGAAPGDEVTVRSPRGEEELTILEVRYR